MQDPLHSFSFSYSVAERQRIGEVGVFAWFGLGVVGIVWSSLVSRFVVFCERLP